MAIYLTDRQVAKRFGVSRASIWRWMKEEGFPTPLRLTAGCTRWRLEDVEKWESSRVRFKSG